MNMYKLFVFLVFNNVKNGNYEDVHVQNGLPILKIVSGLILHVLLFRHVATYILIANIK